jgi:hypothetical protein
MNFLSACEKADSTEGYFVLSDDGRTIVDEIFMSSLPKLSCLRFVCGEGGDEGSERDDMDDGKY